MTALLKMLLEHASRSRGIIGFASERQITDKNLHRPGLALAGYVGLFTFHRVQIFGNTEINYLKSLAPEERITAVRRLFEFEIPCIVVTNGNNAQALCAACHSGTVHDWHQRCSDCHWNFVLLCRLAVEVDTKAG